MSSKLRPPGRASKQVRGSLLTRRLLASLLSSGGGPDEPVEPHALATPSSPPATRYDHRRPHLPSDPRRVGARSRAARRRHRRHARRDPAERPQLGRGLPPRPGPIGAPRRGPQRPTSHPGRAGRRPAAGPDGPVASGPRLPARGLDGAPAPTGVGERDGATAVGRDSAAGASAARLCLEAAPLRPRPRPAARGRNGGSAARSGACRVAASCSPRTRPSC